MAPTIIRLCLLAFRTLTRRRPVAIPAARV